MRQRRIFAPQRRPRTYWLVPVVILAAGVAAFIAATTRDSTPSSPPVSRGAEPVHIHGLGVNPQDGALFIATHTGLYRQGPAEETPTRVGDNHQDTMGFAVVGPDHFVGSGHPDVRMDLPPLLGLIESRDAGQTWQPISLLGKADFHALRVRGNSIFGYDSTNYRMMVSRDVGRTWTSRPVPEPLIDLVSDPAGRVLIAATESNLLRSRDGGASWTAINEAPGLLAWPASERLYLLAVDGRLWRSPNGGRQWERIAEVGGRPAAFLVIGNRMYAALHEGSVKQSDDGGRTWRTLGWSA